MYLLGIHMTAKGQRSQNADFTAGIVAFHIGRRVALCIAQLLGQRQSVIKGHLLPNHLGEDEIGGAVENTGNPDHVVGRQTLADGPDNGNTAADAGFKQEIQVVFLGDGQQLCALCRHQLFIGSDHALAIFQTGLYIIKRRMQTTHDFHDNLHLGVIENYVKVLDKPVCKGTVGKVPQIENIFNAEFFFCPFGNTVYMNPQHLTDTGAHNAITHDCDFHHCIYPTF